MINDEFDLHETEMNLNRGLRMHAKITHNKYM